MISDAMHQVCHQAVSIFAPRPMQQIGRTIAIDVRAMTEQEAGVRNPGSRDHMLQKSDASLIGW